MKLERIKLSDYLVLEDRSMYDFFIQFADKFNRPENVLKLPLLEEWPFGVIKDLQISVQDGMTLQQEIEIISKFTSIKGIYLDDYTRTAKWMYAQLEVLTYKEVSLLSGSVNVVGAEKLQPIALYLQKRVIAKELMITIEAVDKLKYTDAFIELYTQKILKEVENENIRHNKATT